MSAQNESQNIPAVETAEELTTFIKGLMEDMQAQYNEMASAVTNSLDDISSRVNGLENTVNALMQQVPQ